MVCVCVAGNVKPGLEKKKDLNVLSHPDTHSQAQATHLCGQWTEWCEVSTAPPLLFERNRMPKWVLPSPWQQKRTQNNSSAPGSSTSRLPRVFVTKHAGSWQRLFGTSPWKSLIKTISQTGSVQMWPLFALSHDLMNSLNPSLGELCCCFLLNL